MLREDVHPQIAEKDRSRVRQAKMVIRSSFVFPFPKIMGRVSLPTILSPWISLRLKREDLTIERMKVKANATPKTGDSLSPLLKLCRTTITRDQAKARKRSLEPGISTNLL